MARRRPNSGENLDYQDAGERPQQDDQIRDRAYFRYLERGGEEGHAEEDWLLAERELREPRELEGDI